MSAIDLSTLSPEQLAKLLQGPAAPPPPGILANFVNPDTRAPMAIGLSALIMVIMFGFVGARCYSKVAVSKTFGLEDLACLLSAVLTTGYTGLSFASLRSGGLGPHIWNLRLEAIYNNRFFQELIATQSIYPITLFSVKLSLFLLIRRIFGPNRVAQSLVWAGIATTFLFYFITFVLTLVWCAPAPGDSPIDSASAPSCQVKVQAISIVQAGFNVASDLYLLLIPIPVVIRLQLSPQRKFGIIIVFLTGLLASILSILVVYYRVQVRNRADTSWKDIPVIITSVWEANIGVIVGCMPCLPALAKSQSSRHLFSLRTWFRLSNLSSRRKRSTVSESSILSTSNNVSGSFNRIASNQKEQSVDVELGQYKSSSIIERD